MILALFTATTVSTVALPDTAYGRIVTNEEAKTAVVLDVTTPPKNTEEIVRSYFKDVPVLIEVARCESEFRHQLKDGSVLTGRIDPADTGVMQINKRFHQATATKMELNIDDIFGNLAYARHLYETQGTRPWNASMSCWGHTLAANL